MLDYRARVGRHAAEDALGTLPRQVIALQLLSEHGPLRQQGLAEALSLDPSNVVGLLNEFEEQALVTRRRDPADRRRHIIDLADEERWGELLWALSEPGGRASSKGVVTR